MATLNLGKTKDSALTLSTKTLQRHFGCFGSSGSGKTVACKVLIEELARNGIPVIAFDPQGDIASLALLENQATVIKRGTDGEILKSFADNVEVVIWTPASSKGLPLCINPLQFDDLENLNNEDQIRYFAATAKNLAALLDYNLENDEGKTAETLLSLLFEYAYKNNVALDDFSDVIDLLNDIPDKISDTIGAIANTHFIALLVKKLSILSLGSRKLLFQTGIPASIDTLLGLDQPTGKTRVSIIYLNTLNSSEEKEFFISSIAHMLYNWMLRNPPAEDFESIQCAMFIDEIAPYIPPVSKPACKESLELLFRQGRKYGVSCIIATQSPGDIDYKAIGQFSSFALGTLNTRQDINKVKHRMESIAPTEVDFITQKLPSLKPGEFLIASPDEFDKVCQFKVRWLVTKHPLVISEDKIPQLVSGELRQKYMGNRTEKIEEPTGTSLSQDFTSKDNMDEDEILHVNNKIYERDLKKKIRPLLNGGLLKSEVFDEARFEYIPLIKVVLDILREKGLFKKKILKIPENLYLDYKTKTILYRKDKKIMVAKVLDVDPNKIVDLDDFCEITSVYRGEVDFDFRKLGGKTLDFKAIKHSMERKYRVHVKTADLVLFPVWHCRINQKKGNEHRIILIDGVLGNEMILDQ